jgi:hypothetical protein
MKQLPDGGVDPVSQCRESVNTSAVGENDVFGEQLGGTAAPGRATEK